ncbi:MAG TPA: HAMP domain-containing protein [Methylophaga sp.]|nr:HAMP domain-containing protein [Methylophaga sp.]
MQMCLILVTGYALATTSLVRSMIHRLADIPTSTAAAAAIVGLVACICGLVNWGLGLIVGALLAREVGFSMQRRNKPCHYPLIAAAGYVGLLVWHGGLSGSAPLSMTTKLGAEKVVPTQFLDQLESISLSSSIGSPMNLLISGGLVLLIPTVLASLAPKNANDIRPIDTFGVDSGGRQEPIQQHEHLPDKLNHSPYIAWLLAVPLLIGSGLIAAIFFSAILAWYFTKPIGLLRQSFAKLAEGQLQTRIGEKMGRRHDELVELGKNFDDMAGKIGHLMSAQQRLLHDVSHELRSPLARMQAAIGIAEQQPEKTHEILNRIERESQRMSDLVGELLVLSRLETGVTDNVQTEICLNDLLDEIISDARFEASSKEIKIHYSAIEDIFITVRSELIHRAIENILRNAIKFSPLNSEVKLTVSTDSEKHRLSIVIEDNGPGVAEADLESIFKPFFRGHLTERNDSIGLGLAIAYRAIDTHGGEIKASNRENGGLRVEVNLPYKK